MPRDGTIRVGQIKGMNTVLSPDQIADNELVFSSNMDLSNGTLKKRLGFSYLFNDTYANTYEGRMVQFPKTVVAAGSTASYNLPPTGNVTNQGYIYQGYAAASGSAQDLVVKSGSFTISVTAANKVQVVFTDNVAATHTLLSQSTYTVTNMLTIVFGVNSVLNCAFLYVNGILQDYETPGFTWAGNSNAAVLQPGTHSQYFAPAGTASFLTSSGSKYLLHANSNHTGPSGNYRFGAYFPFASTTGTVTQSDVPVVPTRIHAYQGRQTTTLHLGQNGVLLPTEDCVIAAGAMGNTAYNGVITWVALWKNAGLSTMASELPISSKAVRLGKWTVLAAGGNLFKVDGAVCLRIRLTNPSHALTAAVTGGALTGEYKYVYTYYNVDDGSESNASPLVSASPAAQNVRLTANASRTTFEEPSTTHIRIYRTAAGGTKYYYLTQITETNFQASIAAGTYLYEDSTTDTTLLAGAAIEEDNDHLSLAFGTNFQAITIEEYDGRLWVASCSDTSATGGTIYYSKAGSVDAYPNSLTVQGIGYISDLCRVGSSLVVFGTKGLAVISTSGSDYQVQSIPGSPGCLFPNSVGVLNGVAYFITTRGLVATDGYSSTLHDGVGFGIFGKLTGTDHLNFKNSFYIVPQASKGLLHIMTKTTYSSAILGDNRVVVVYKPSTGQWWTNEYGAPAIGVADLTIWSGLTTGDVGEFQERFLIARRGAIFKEHDTFTTENPRGTDTSYTGTVTSRTATTITDSGASFGTSSSFSDKGLAGALCYVYAGTGAPWWGIVESSTGTVLTFNSSYVKSACTNLGTDSKYVVGGIWSKFTTKEYLSQFTDKQARVLSVGAHFRKQSAANPVTINIYADQSGTAKDTQTMNQDGNSGFGSVGLGKCKGRSIQLQVESFLGGKPFEITGLSLDIDPAGMGDART